MIAEDMAALKAGEAGKILIFGGGWIIVDSTISGLRSGGVEGSLMTTAKNLTETRAGAVLRILSVEGGQSFRQRLFALGFHVGDKITIQGRGPFRGPYLVTNLTTGTCLAIGRVIAKRIQVEETDVG